MAKASKKRMSKHDQEMWDQLYQYVRHTVMGYDDNQSLSRNMVLRLKGLLNNKFMANNNIEDTANYSYDVVLNTFKFCMPDIRRGFISNNFVDEMHRFNYAMKIVESNLNTVYMRMKGAENAKKEVERAKVSVVVNQGVSYKPKKKIEDKFSDLW